MLMKAAKNMIVGRILKANWNPNPGHPASGPGKKYLPSIRFPNKNLAPKPDRARKSPTFLLNVPNITLP